MFYVYLAWAMILVEDAVVRLGGTSLLPSTTSSKDEYTPTKPVTGNSFTCAVRQHHPGHMPNRGVLGIFRAWLRAFVALRDFVAFSAAFLGRAGGIG
jgi:hypothetical protein